MNKDLQKLHLTLGCNGSYKSDEHRNCVANSSGSVSQFNNSGRYNDGRQAYEQSESERENCNPPSLDGKLNICNSTTLIQPNPNVAQKQRILIKCIERSKLSIDLNQQNSSISSSENHYQALRQKAPSNFNSKELLNLFVNDSFSKINGYNR